MIRFAHFQLTGRCNLRCTFCGQQNGMFGRREAIAELPAARWTELAGELAQSSEITLWGGEPLVYGEFDQLATTLSQGGAHLGIVTNGVLIDRHKQVLCEHFDTIKISLDGTKEYHDSIRGAGVFDKVRENLACLKKRRGRLIFLTTLADSNVEDAPEIVEELSKLGPDQILIQQLMYLTEQEIAAYRALLRDTFGCDDPSIEVWRRDEDADYRRKVTLAIERIARRRYACPVAFNCYGGSLICRAPWERVHIKYDGSVLFCTDYYGFSAGSVKESSLEEILASPRAEKFRKAVREGKFPPCGHCSWRNSPSL
ncbi:MAG: radical SAM protein [Victivallaceae bacterium]|nr:radical SAM protein [Victivallaceae bacterium]